MCPTGRRDTFSPRTWDQGSLYPGLRPEKKGGVSQNMWEADVLILAAKNLNKFRFQTNIWSAMTMVRVKCSEHNFHIASFSAEQVVIK